jgi:hypothetical protein
MNEHGLWTKRHPVDGRTTKQDEALVIDASEVEKAIQLWRGIKPTLYPIVNEPDPVTLWKNAHPKIWALYMGAGTPYQATEDGLWRWLLDQNRIVSQVRIDRDNEWWDQGLGRLRNRLHLGTDQPEG